MRHFLKGKETIPYKEWQETNWNIIFDNDTIQGDASIQKITLVGEDYDVAYDWIFNQKKFLVGLPYKIVLEEDNKTLETEGYLHQFEFDTDLQIVSCTFSKRADIYSFLQSVSKLTFQNLYDEGYISNFRKEGYLIIPNDVADRLAYLSFMYFTLSYTVYRESLTTFEIIQKQIKAISEALALDTGSASTVIEATLILLFVVASYVLLVYQLSKLMIEMIELFVYKLRFHNTATFRQLLTAILDKHGLKLQTNITRLDDAYLPSNPYGGEIKVGIPRIGDYGHSCLDFLSLINQIHGTKSVVNDGIFYLYHEKDPFWKMSSSYVMKDVLQLTKFEIPTNYDATRFYKFSTDVSNAWTVENFTGTNSITITKDLGLEQDEFSLLSGYSENIIPLCLISTYNELNLVDKSIQEVLKLADSFVKIIGGKPQFYKKFVRKLGAIKFTQEYHSMPYYVPLVNGKIPKNHRDIMNAGVVNDNNYYKSIVKNQYLRFNLSDIPMSKSEFFGVLKNSTFTLNDGREGRFREGLSWCEETETFSGIADIETELSNEIVDEKYAG